MPEARSPDYIVDGKPLSKNKNDQGNTTANETEAANSNGGAAPADGAAATSTATAPPTPAAEPEPENLETAQIHNKANDSSPKNITVTKTRNTEKHRIVSVSKNGQSASNLTKAALKK